MSDWPTCPNCQARRLARCPICSTSGTDFKPADTDISALLGVESPAHGGGCSCGPGGCGPVTADQTAGDSGEPAAEGDVPALLMCPTCDEPFTPSYPRRCEWCGYTFDDGWEPDDLPRPVDPINGRIIVVSLLVAAVLIGTVAYLMWLPLSAK
jgi:hypothetical protein